MNPLILTNGEASAMAYPGPTLALTAGATSAPRPAPTSAIEAAVAAMEAAGYRVTVIDVPGGVQGAMGHLAAVVAAARSVCEARDTWGLSVSATDWAGGCA